MMELVGNGYGIESTFYIQQIWIVSHNASSYRQFMFRVSARRGNSESSTKVHHHPLFIAHLSMFYNLKIVQYKGTPINGYECA